MCAHWNNQLPQRTLLLRILAIHQDHLWSLKKSNRCLAVLTKQGGAWAILIFKSPTGHSDQSVLQVRTPENMISKDCIYEWVKRLLEIINSLCVWTTSHFCVLTSSVSGNEWINGWISHKYSTLVTWSLREFWPWETNKKVDSRYILYILPSRIPSRILDRLNENEHTWSLFIPTDSQTPLSD